MLLSTIFKRGIKGKEQCTGKLFCGKNAVCALGGIALGLGIVNKSGKNYGFLKGKIRNLLGENSVCVYIGSVLKASDYDITPQSIYRKNDGDKLSFKEIYDWLRSIEKRNGIKGVKLPS